MLDVKKNKESRGLVQFFKKITKFDKMHKKLSCLKSVVREELNCKKFSENNSVEK